MVAVGFKAKWSAAFLVLVLSVFNVFANNWWQIPSAHPQRDFLKYVTLFFFLVLAESPFHSLLTTCLFFAYPDMISSRRSVRIPLFVSRYMNCTDISSTAIVGGLILLVNMGPGGLSVDEKKKNF